MSVKVYNKRGSHRIPTECIQIDCTSNGSWSTLSPFFLGPVNVCPFDEVIVSQNVENAWQYSKCFHENRDEYIKWAKQGFSNKKVNRFPMGRGAKPMYSLHKGQQLGYIDARKQIYVPLYSEAVEKYASKKLNQLRQMYRDGKHIALIDYDGYSDYKSFDEVLNNPHKIMGHAFVLEHLIKMFPNIH